MYTTELLKRAIAELKPAQLVIWLVAADLGYENVSNLTINDAREYGITESTFYRNKNGIKVPCKDIYTDEYLDAIEQAAAKEAQISMKSSWQDKFKSIDLRSDRLKKVEKGLNTENDELISTTKPKPKFTPIDIGAIESDNYTQFDDAAELDKLEQEQKRKRSMLSYI